MYLMAYDSVKWQLQWDCSGGLDVTSRWVTRTAWMQMEPCKQPVTTAMLDGVSSISSLKLRLQKKVMITRTLLTTRNKMGA